MCSCSYACISHSAFHSIQHYLSRFEIENKKARPWIGRWCGKTRTNREVYKAHKAKDTWDSGLTLNNIYIYTHVGVYVFVSYMCDHTRAACHRSQTENMCLIERSLWKALRAKRWHFVSHCKPLCYHSTGQQTPGIEDLTPGLLNHVTVIMFLANLLDLCWTLMGQYFLNGSCQKLTFRTHS